MSSCQECTACYDPGIEIGFINSDILANGFYMGFAAYKSTPENVRKRYTTYNSKIQSESQYQENRSSFNGCGGCPQGGRRPMISNGNSNYNATLEAKTIYSAVQESDGAVYIEKSYSWEENDQSQSGGFPGGGSCVGNDCTGPYAVSSIGNPSSNSSNSGSISYREVPKTSGPCLGFWDVNPYKRVGEKVKKSNTSQENSYQDIPEEDRYCEPVKTTKILSDEFAKFSYPAVCSGPNVKTSTTTDETNVTISYKENAIVSRSAAAGCTDRYGRDIPGSYTSSFNSSYSCNASNISSVENEYDVYEKSLYFATIASAINMESELKGKPLCGGYGGPRYGDTDYNGIISGPLTHINSLLTDEEMDHYKYYDIYDGWQYPYRIQYQNKYFYIQVAKDVFDRIESFVIKIYFYVLLTNGINPCNGGEVDEDYISIKETSISCDVSNIWRTTEDHNYFLGQPLTSDDAIPTGDTHYKNTDICYVIETINFKA